MYIEESHRPLEPEPNPKMNDIAVRMSMFNGRDFNCEMYSVLVS